MAKVLSFSVDDDLDMEGLVQQAGYTNRSRFLRDAATHYAEVLSSGDLVDRPAEDSVEGTLVLYYQHTVADKLPDFRHHAEISLISSTHACMTNSHTCVDTLHLWNGRHHSRLRERPPTARGCGSRGLRRRPLPQRRMLLKSPFPRRFYLAIP